VINFPCHNCGEELSVPTDLAGGEIQCPTCAHLTSVPLVSDLPHLRPDGTHALSPVIEREEADRLADLARSFGRRRVDADGEEIDNRTQPDAIDLAPLPPPPARHAPRYDPETGERLDPLDLAREAPIPAVPFGPLDRPGPPVAQYATPGRTGFTPQGSVWMQLFTPGNTFVMAVVWLAHIAGGIIDFFVRYLLTVIEKVGGQSIPAWPFNIFFFLVVAHYSIVIFETGEEELNELPRPLRNGSFGEDVFLPVVRAGIAYVLAYLPALLLPALPQGQASRLVLAAGLVWGGVFFPALLLAACGSNSLANLRPDRVLRVIRSCGWAYWRLVIITVPLVPLYLWSAAGVNFVETLLGNTKLGNLLAAALARGLVALPLLTLCVYAAHGVCWRLGQLQRLYRGQFGWFWEVHESERLADRRRRQAEREAAARRRQSGQQRIGQQRVAG